MKIMRFYTRINKPFNTDVYLKFYGPSNYSSFFDTAEAKSLTINKNLPTSSEINLIIRRCVENMWALRVGKSVVITQKGLNALAAHEKENNLSERLRRERRYEEHAEFLKIGNRERNTTGQYK